MGTDVPPSIAGDRIRLIQVIIYSVVGGVFATFTLAYVTADLTVGVRVAPFVGILRDLIISSYPEVFVAFVTFVVTAFFLAPVRDAQRTMDEMQLVRRIESHMIPSLYRNALIAHDVAESLRASGLVGVDNDLDFRSIHQRMVLASRRVDILETWIWFEARELKGLFESLSRTKISVRIALLAPDSPFAKQRSLDLGREQGYVPGLIRETIRSLRDFRDRYQMNGMQIRQYHSLPSLQLIICDDFATVGFYWRLARSQSSTQLRVRLRDDNDQPTLFGRRIEEEFEATWESAASIA